MPIDKLLKNPNASTALTGALTGAAGGALVSAFTNKKSAKKLLKGAGLVAVGGMAWQAYQSYRNNNAAPKEAAAITQQEFDAVVAPQESSTAPLILQAMIAAAHADAHLTAEEQQRIWQQALDQGLPADQLDTLQQQMQTPPSMQQLIAACPDMATKIEVYTASLLALDEHCAAGSAYLQTLADALALPAPLVDTLHQQCGHNVKDQSFSVTA